jgi:hypothetical protein
MENNLNYATIGAPAPDTYANTLLQDNSDLDYQPISPRPAPPAPSAAASNDSQDQAARLRALLSSHLSEGRAGNIQATGADRLEALIDMLYAMTASANAISAAAPIVSEEKPSLAPTAETYAVTLPEPIRNAPISESRNVEAAPAPTSPAPVETPAAQVMETASASASQNAQNSAAPHIPTPFAAVAEPAPSVVSEAQAASHFAVVSDAQSAPHFAAPESPESIEVHRLEAYQTEARQTEIQQEQEQAQLLDSLLTTQETTAEPAMVGESIPVLEPQVAQEPTASIAASPAASVTGESMAGDAQLQPRSSTTAEVLTMEERSALLNPLKEDSVKEERAAAAGTITFNFATDKSTATLNIPIQPNLSLVTFEQHSDEIILKIHLSI